MLMGVLNWLFLGFIIFCSVMVMIRFVFYRDQKQARSAVYLWGGVLFMALGVYDLTANLFFEQPLHTLQNVLFFSLTAVAVYRAVRARRSLAIQVS